MAIRQTITLDVSHYRRSLGVARRELDAFTRDSGRSGRRLGQDLADGARDAGSAWERAGSRIKGTLTGLVGIVAGLFAVDRLRGFIASMLELNGTLETTRMRFEALTGSAAEARRVMAELDAYADARVESRDTVYDAAARLMASGTAASELTTTLRGLSEAAAALSAANPDAAIDRMADAVARLQAGGRFTSFERQFRTLGVDVLAVLERQTGRTRAALEQMIKDGLLPASQIVQQLSTGLGTQFAGAAERATRGFSARISAIREQLANAFRDAFSGLFDAVSDDVGALMDSLAGGQYRTTFERIGAVTEHLYRSIRSVVKATLEWGPTLLSLGAGVAVVTTLSKVFGAAQQSLQGLASVELGSVTREYERLSRLAQENKIELMIQPNSPAASEWAREMDQANAKLPELQRRIDHLQRTGVPTFRSLGAQTSAWVRNLLSVPNILTIVSSLVVGLAVHWYRTSRAVDDVTRKLREQRDAAREVLTEVAKIPGAVAASRQMEMQLELRLNEQSVRDAESRIAELEQALVARNDAVVRPDGSVQVLPGARGEEANELRRIRRSHAELTGTIEAQREAISSLDRVASNSFEGQRRRLQMQIEMERDKGHLAAAELDTIQAIDRARGRLLDDTSASAQSLRQGLESLARAEDAVRRAADGRVDTDRIEEWQRQLDAVERRMRERGLLPEPTVTRTPTSDAERREIEADLERLALLQRRLDAEERLSGLADGALAKQQEANRLLEEALMFEEHAAVARRRGQDALAVRIDGVATRRRADADALSAEARSLQAVQDALERMGPQAQAFVEELGGIDRFLAQLTPADLESILPRLQEIEAWTETLNRRLAEVRRNVDLELISEDEAREQGEAIGREYRDGLVQMLSEIPEDLPEPLAALMEQYLSALAGVIASTRENTASTKEGGAALRDLVTAGRGLAGLARAFGNLSRESDRFLSGVLDAVDALDQLQRRRAELAERREEGAEPSAMDTLALLPGYVGIAGGIVGALAPLFQGRGEEQRRLAQQMRENARAVRDNTDALLNQGHVGAEYSREQLKELRRLMDAAPQFNGRQTSGIFGIGNKGGRDRTAQDFFEDLLDLGVASDAVRLAQQAYALEMERSGHVTLAMAAAMEVLEDTVGGLVAAFGDYSDNVSGWVQRLRDDMEFLGSSAAEALERLLDDVVAGMADLSPAVEAALAEIRGLDLTSESGRDRLQELIALLWTERPDTVSIDDWSTLLREIMRSGDEAGGPQTSRTVQALSQITEYQADVLIGVQREALYVLRRIASAMDAVPRYRLPETVYADPVYAGTAAATPSRTGERRSGDGASVHVDVAVNGLGITTLDELVREIDRHLRRHPDLH